MEREMSDLHLQLLGKARVASATHIINASKIYLNTHVLDALSERYGKTEGLFVQT
jgi:hypothetical protein